MGLPFFPIFHYDCIDYKNSLGGNLLMKFQLQTHDSHDMTHDWHLCLSLIRGETPDRSSILTSRKQGCERIWNMRWELHMNDCMTMISTKKNACFTWRLLSLFTKKKSPIRRCTFWCIYHLSFISVKFKTSEHCTLSLEGLPPQPRNTLPQRMSCPPGDELAYVKKLKRFLPPRQKQQQQPTNHQPTNQPTNQPTKLN